MNHTHEQQTGGDEKGFMLIELLVIVALLAIFALTMLQANMTSMRSRGKAQLYSYASQIAAESLEEYAAIDPINLDNTDDYADTVERLGHQFSRTVDVTVNSDSSRTVVVTVSSSNPLYPTSVSVQGVFAMWGSL